jgi:hypothetical protein
MKKVKMSSFEDMRTLVHRALFVLTLFFTLGVSVQNLGAQVVVGPPPNWISSGEANTVIVNEMTVLQGNLNGLPPGPAANAIEEVLELYDLIQANIIQTDDVGNSVYEAFGAQFGQVPVVYASGTPNGADMEAATNITYTPQQSDALSPKIGTPSYSGVLSLYYEVANKLSN